MTLKYTGEIPQVQLANGRIVSTDEEFEIESDLGEKYRDQHGNIFEEVGG